MIARAITIRTNGVRILPSRASRLKHSLSEVLSVRLREVRILPSRASRLKQPPRPLWPSLRPSSQNPPFSRVEIETYTFGRCLISPSHRQNPPFSRVEIETTNRIVRNDLAFSQNPPFSRVEIETPPHNRPAIVTRGQNPPFSRVEIETNCSGPTA